MPLVEKALQAGKTLLLEDVGETIDGALDPLIKQQFFDEGEDEYAGFLYLMFTKF